MYGMDNNMNIQPISIDIIKNITSSLGNTFKKYTTINVGIDNSIVVIIKYLRIILYIVQKYTKFM